MDIRKMMESEEGLDKMEKLFLNLDSEFRFKCRRCGKCCKHQDTIIFNTRDIFNIAQKLGMTMIKVMEALTERYIGHDSRIPIVHLLSNGPGKSCPLLKDGRCSVHDCKPTVCALFPLGRVVLNKDTGNSIDPQGALSVRYIINDIECGSTTRVNTVRNWLARFGIPEEDEFFLLWNKVIIEQGLLVRKLEKHKVSSSLIELIWSIQFNLLYAQYDTTQDFMPQFQAAAQKLAELNTFVLKAKELTDSDNELAKLMEDTAHET